MTDAAFEQIVGAFDHASELYAQFMASSQLFRQQHPEGYAVHTAVAHAWQQLTPIQQANALQDLFISFANQVCAEETEDRLMDAVESAHSYISGDDLYWVQEPLAFAGPVQDDTQVLVPAKALGNVLAELELLQHRLSMQSALSGGDHS